MADDSIDTFQVPPICPVCGAPLAKSSNSANSGRRWLECDRCKSRYAVKSQIPDMLPETYKKVIAGWKTNLSDARFLQGIDKSTQAFAVANGIDWLGAVLGIPVEELRKLGRRSRSLDRMLACLLPVIQSNELDERDKRELYSILSSELMAVGYRRHVADPAVAPLEAVNYEKYEDILLRRILNSSLSQSDSVIMIELGSGVGRVLHQYGSCISHNPRACVTYRRHLELYRPETLTNPDALDLLIGLDFSDYMLTKSARWLQQDNLGDLVRSGRIVQVLGSVRKLDFDFEAAGLEDSRRVVCILFQTIGNQIGRDLQVEMLARARALSGKNGVVLVSAFNGATFQEQGREYYESIRGSVGNPWVWGDDFFLSEKGVYSKWLTKSALDSLFVDAGMTGASILTDEDLGVFPIYKSYIDTENQSRYKRRGLIGVYSSSSQAAISASLQ